MISLFLADDNNEISKLLQFVPQVGDIFDVKDKVGEGSNNFAVLLISKLSII